MVGVESVCQIQVRLCLYNPISLENCYLLHYIVLVESVVIEKFLQIIHVCLLPIKFSEGKCDMRSEIKQVNKCTRTHSTNILHIIILLNMLSAVTCYYFFQSI